MGKYRISFTRLMDGKRLISKETYKTKRTAKLNLKKYSSHTKSHPKIVKNR